MATREENLKKINEELEKLSDEQLEEVAGGLLVGTLNSPVKVEKQQEQVDNAAIGDLNRWVNN